MVYVQKTWRHLFVVCDADAQRLLAEADARQGTDAGGAAAAAVSHVQDGTPAGAALHTAHHAEPDNGGGIPQYLRDPLMIAYVEARKKKTAADKISVQPLLSEPHAGASSSQADKSTPNVPEPELAKTHVDVSTGCLQLKTSSERGSGHT